MTRPNGTMRSPRRALTQVCRARPARVAATWTPYDVSVPITWAALDCPGYFAAEEAAGLALLGKMAATIHRPVRAGERLIARGIVVFAILIWSLNFVPAPPEPRDCSVNAVVSWTGQLNGTRPQSVSLQAGEEQLYPVGDGRPVAMLSSAD